MSSRLYVVDPASTLHTLDPATGSARAVGPTNLANVTDIAFHGPTAFDSNDVLYGALDQGGTVVLARIDRSSGAPTVIGAVGLGTLYGLAFHCCRLYGATSAGEVVDVNVASAAATVIGRNGLVQWGLASSHCC